MSRLLSGGSTQCRRWCGRIVGAALGITKGIRHKSDSLGKASFLSGTALRPFRETRYDMQKFSLGSAVIPLRFHACLCTCGCPAAHVGLQDSIIVPHGSISADNFVSIQTFSTRAAFLPDHQNGRGSSVSQSWSCTPKAAHGAALHSPVP